MTPSLEHHESVAVVTLGDDENRFSLRWLDEVSTYLDQVEARSQALVTIGSGKFYSNGLDVDWLAANLDRADDYVARVQALLARLVSFPLPTIAAVNGHAFGAGAMLAIAHDFRIMRADRGYYCFPEVDINIPFTPGMAALIQAKLSPHAALTAMTTGHRFTAAQAQAAGLVDDSAAVNELLTAATARLGPILGKDRGTLAAIKSTMYASVITALRQGRD